MKAKLSATMVNVMATLTKADANARVAFAAYTKAAESYNEADEKTCIAYTKAREAYNKADEKTGIAAAAYEDATSKLGVVMPSAAEVCSAAYLASDSARNAHAAALEAMAGFNAAYLSWITAK